MSETDIYKNREAMPRGKKPEKKKRRRRSESKRAFDDHSRKRRSKNSGLRRFLHLSRKTESEKVIWSTTGILAVVLLILIAIWQFFVSEQLIRKQEKEAEQVDYQPRIPDTTDNIGKEPIIQ